VPGDGYGGVNEIRPEWVFETQPVLALDLDGGSTDTLADLPHLRRWLGTRGASPGPIRVRGQASGFTDGFAWARADHSEVRWYDYTGALTQIGRWQEEPAPLTPEWRADVVQFTEKAYASSDAEPAWVAARLAELEEGFDRHEGPLPYWDAFHVDRQGNAWLREFAPLGRPSGRWRVVARDGTFMGWVDVPDVVAILDITDDRVLAVRLDDFDVPAVVMIPLLKM
jgi:hypothetical protein